jgi:hypothetical protein
VAGEEEAVGGHRQVFEPGNGGEPFDEPGQLGAEQGFAAGEAKFADAEPGEEADEPFDFLEGEQFGAGFPGRRIGVAATGAGTAEILEPGAVKVGGLLGLGEAVDAAEIAAVGDADPEVAQYPPWESTSGEVDIGSRSLTGFGRGGVGARGDLDLARRLSSTSRPGAPAGFSGSCRNFISASASASLAWG